MAGLLRTSRGPAVSRGAGGAGHWQGRCGDPDCQRPLRIAPKKVGLRPYRIRARGLAGCPKGQPDAAG